jgi:hypothetical protein
MGTRGRTGGAARRGATALLLALAVGTAACAGDDDSSEVTGPPPLEADTTAAPGSTAAPRCSDERHTVAFDIYGTLTIEDDLSVLADDSSLGLTPRLGAASVATAYRDRGYEILYVSTAPATLEVDGVPLVDAVAVWLEINDFPTGPGTRVWAWESSGDANVSFVEELLRLEQAGVSVDAGYTGNPEKAHAMSSGGIPVAGLWTLGDAAGTPGTTTVNGDDLMAHLPTVERLGMICQPG